MISAQTLVHIDVTHLHKNHLWLMEYKKTIWKRNTSSLQQYKIIILSQTYWTYG